MREAIAARLRRARVALPVPRLVVVRLEHFGIAAARAGDAIGPAVPDEVSAAGVLVGKGRFPLGDRHLVEVCWLLRAGHLGSPVRSEGSLPRRAGKVKHNRPRWLGVKRCNSTLTGLPGDHLSLTRAPELPVLAHYVLGHCARRALTAKSPTTSENANSGIVCLSGGRERPGEVPGTPEPAVRAASVQTHTQDSLEPSWPGLTWLVPAIHELRHKVSRFPWIPVTRPGMTNVMELYYLMRLSTSVRRKMSQSMFARLSKRRPADARRRSR